MEKVKLYNVIDIRTGKFHSVAIVNKDNAKWFIPAVRDEDDNEDGGE